MKNNFNYNFNSLLRICTFVAALGLLAILLAIGLFYYFFSIPEPEGLSLASWPHVFTDNFSAWMESDNGNIQIRDTGMKRLDEYGLWIQVIDESGQEVFSRNKPKTYPTSYPASELIALETSAFNQGNTIFVSNYKASGQTWNYIVGFPYAIGKSMLYYNGENVGRLSPVLRMILFFILCIIFMCVIFYGFWLTRHLGKIARGILSISLRTYTPHTEKGIFGGIYRALNRMDAEICNSDKIQKDTERARREWIANITHDLKTPLSPIRGYAELLADSPVPDSQIVQRYGEIIFKNINHTEKLINDLKLTYQLDSGIIPYHPQEVTLMRWMKELVIDIINDPLFGNRNIEFESNVQGLKVCLDSDLFRRAVGNLVINALTHNPPETKVTITIDSEPQKGVFISVRDNGTGMSETERAEIFSRYYRGTSTGERPEGSGLGLAIAKQIVSLHDGTITVESKLNQGTRFTIFLPY